MPRKSELEIKKEELQAKQKQIEMITEIIGLTKKLNYRNFVRSGEIPQEYKDLIDEKEICGRAEMV